MSDMVRIKLHVGTGFAGCNHSDYEEIPRKEWESMTEQDKEDYLSQAANDYLSNCIEWSAWVEDDE